ncbi:MAG: ethanolamine utilization protein EutH [Clostridia bacterium]|nr:ethanolamine utilization protein EutH [Clostridia bacterium]
MKLEYIFAFFAVIGALDKIFGNKFKLGDEFEKGIMTIGVLVFSMAGTMVLAPVMAQGLSFVFEPIAKFLHIDVSMISIFIANDSGGAAMAYEMSADEQIRAYNGLIVGSMFGATICPIVPLSLKIVDKKYHEDVLTGLLCGIATIPVGCIVAGIIMQIPFGKLIINTIPMIVLSAVICLGLAKAPDLTRKIFGGFGALLMIIIVAGLAVGIVDQLAGIKLIPGIAPLADTFVIICNIGIILSGVFPLLAIVSRVCKKLFVKLGNALEINETSVLGFVTTLANSVPMLSMMENMNKKGRILNMAFAVSAAFVLGDHLAFTIAFDGKYVMPMMVGKLISGFAAFALANLVYKKMKTEEEQL